VPRLPPRHPVPTLVMGAAEDAFIPRSMVRRTARYYDAEPLIVPGMAHAMMLEENWRHAADPVLFWLREQGL
jgi:pimeloyl-ACP methyl ester carboxylesterase